MRYFKLRSFLALILGIGLLHVALAQFPGAPGGGKLVFMGEAKPIDEDQPTAPQEGSTPQQSVSK